MAAAVETSWAALKSELPEWRGVVWGWETEVAGLRSRNRCLQDSRWDVKCSLGNIVNNIVIITLCAARWVLGIWGNTRYSLGRSNP